MVAPARSFQPSSAAKRYAIAVSIVLGVAALLGAGLLSLGHRTTGKSRPSAVSKLKAAAEPDALFMESEATLWTLQGTALKEARGILLSGESRRIAQSGKDDPSAEEALRNRLRRSRSPELRTATEGFREFLDPASDAVIEDASRRMGIDTVDFLLDWITYEAALDYGSLLALWHQRESAHGEEVDALFRSFFQDSQTRPDLDRGVRVLSKTDRKIIVSLYGATVIEEIVPYVFEAEPDALTIGWKSNYERLRSILSGESRDETIKERVERDKTGLAGISHKPYFEEFLTKGFNRPWATLLTEDDPIALSRFVREEELRDKTATNAENPPLLQDNLQELFRRLSPSVPMVESVGKGNGSGFIVKRGGTLALITNRHVVEEARRIRLHFFPAEAVEKKETFDLKSDATISFSRDADLALLSLGRVSDDLLGRGIRPMEISDDDPAVGENVFVIGHPGAGQQVLTTTLTNGIVSGLRAVDGFGPCVQVTAPINPGNSGGPLFNSKGEVVGVVTFTARRGNDGLALEGLNFASSVKSLKELLSERPPRSSSHSQEAEKPAAPPPKQINKDGLESAVAVVKKYLDLHISGEEPKAISACWHPEERSSAFILFSVRDYKILQKIGGAETDGAVVTARISSSTKGGLPIITDWAFFLKQDGNGDFKITLVTER